jgi:hypothetical protein
MAGAINSLAVTVGVACCMQWDAVENKSTVLTYAGGAIVGVWFSSVVVGAVNNLPLVRRSMTSAGHIYTSWIIRPTDSSETLTFVWFLQLPKIMELVGLGYTGWFVYRYLLFKVRDYFWVDWVHLIGSIYLVVELTRLQHKKNL